MNLKLEELQQLETEMLKEIVAICHQNKIQYFLAYGSVLGAVRHGGPIPWDYDVDIAVPYNQLARFISVLRKKLPSKYYLNYHDNDPYYPELLPRIGLKGYSTKVLHIDVFLLIGAPAETKKHRWFKNWARFYTFIFKYKNFNQIHFGTFTKLKQKLFTPIVKLILLPFSNTYMKKKFKQLCEKYPFETATYIVNPQFGYGMKEFIPKEYYGAGKTVAYADLEVLVPLQFEDYLSHIYGDYMQFPPLEERQTPSFYKVDKRAV